MSVYVAIAVAHLADFLTFAVAASVLGIGGEANPLAVMIYGAWGIVGIFVFKATMVSIGSVLVLSMGRLRKVGAGLIIGVGLLGFLTNSLALALTR